VGGDRDGNWAAGVSPSDGWRRGLDCLAQQFFCLQLPSQPKVELLRLSGVAVEAGGSSQTSKVGAELGSDVRC